MVHAPCWGNHFDGFILESSNRVKDEADYIKRVSAQKDRELNQITKLP
jgi:hypothetical protein